MKKILIMVAALMALTAGAFATGGDAEFCEQHPDSPICGGGDVIIIEGPQGPAGEDGVDGVDGVDGKDGIDGKDGQDGQDGLDGRDGSDGMDGMDGKDGADGKDGLDGQNGVDGRDGIDGSNGVDGNDGVDGKDGLDGKDGADGANGRDGIDGVDGADGEDGVVDYSYIDKTFEYTRDVAAGSMAVSAIDFGTTCEGVTEGGIGIGYADSFNGSSTAIGIGIKHGMTDADAIIIKAWGVDSDSYAVGAGLTHRF